MILTALDCKALTTNQQAILKVPKTQHLKSSMNTEQGMLDTSPTCKLPLL